MVRFTCSTALVLLSLLTFSFALNIPKRFLTQKINKDVNSLDALFIVHRHGDRTIISTFPTDKYVNESYWPDGWGELTEAGKARMYNVGQFLRSRYDGFLTDNIREATVRSSPIERCLESTQLVLNGMYNPKGRWVWNSSEPWQPFPIQTTFADKDSMLNPDSHCPAASKEFQKIMNSSYVFNLTNENQDLLDYLTENCGEQVQDLFTAEYVFDSLKIEKIVGYEWPSWVTDDIYNRLSKLSDLTFYIEFMTRAAQRFRTGVFFADLQNRINKFVNKNQSNLKHSVLSTFDNNAWKKVFVYSSHDTFVSALLTALGVFNDLAPPFGATVLFELHSSKQANSQSTSFIRTFYLNETETKQPHTIQLPACDFEVDCPVDKFLNGISDLIIDDWHKECKVKDDQVFISPPKRLNTGSLTFQNDLESGTF